MLFVWQRALAAIPILPLCIAATPDDAFPLIDLGYATHAPTFVNETSSGLKYASYNNIRFAEPPLADLRFRRPKTPPLRQTGIQNGSAPRFSTDCVSAVPNFWPDVGSGAKAWGSEDCLFLNVKVPEGVKEGDKLPVVHWVHGSAFSFGSKDFKEYTGDGSGLYEQLDKSTQKFIYVASNYRMGLFGWASSPYEDMGANVGLHDSLAAIRWTQQYISKFGGDPDKITAMGQSAGAGMLNLLMVAKDGHEELPFHQAFIASPAVWPRRDPSRRLSVYNAVLEAANCTSITCLREASEEQLFNANSYLISNATDGASGALGPGPGFTAVVDGVYIRDFLPKLFQEGKYNKGVKRVISGNMVNEGQSMSPDANMPKAFPALVRATAPNVSDEDIARIQALYNFPPELPQKLAWDWATDMTFACNAYHAANAYGNQAQRYAMSIPPGIHGLDMNYWFYQNNVTTPVANLTIARQFQEYVRRFITGSANEGQFSSLADWPEYGTGEKLFNVTLDGFEVQNDHWGDNQRCRVISEILSDCLNGA